MHFEIRGIKFSKMNPDLLLYDFVLRNSIAIFMCPNVNVNFRISSRQRNLSLDQSGIFFQEVLF